MVKNSTPQKRILFFSSVKTKKMFSIQQFHRIDICILRDLGYQVYLTNSIFSFLVFWRYDISYIYFYKYGVFSAFISKIFNKKVIFTGGIDDLYLPLYGRKKYYIQKILFSISKLLANKIIFVSNSDIYNCSESLEHSKKNELIFHSIDVSKFDEFSSDMKQKLVVTISWMIDSINHIRKGVDKSLLLFKEIHKIDSEYRMIIIGPEGEGSRILKKQIMDLGLTNEVTFTGAIDEAAKITYLKQSSLYLQLSLYEGFGIAAIEALASGNIVVHTGKGGLADGVGKHGVIIKDESYHKVAQQVIEILNNKKVKDQYISNGIGYVRENFDYKVRLRQIESVLNDIA